MTVRSMLENSKLPGFEKKSNQESTFSGLAKDARKEGWLEKKSKFLGEWRKRWIVLTPAYLFTYKEENGKMEVTEKVLLKNIEQIFDTPQDSGSCLIDMKLMDGKKYQMRAQTKEEAIQWILEVEKCRRKA